LQAAYFAASKLVAGSTIYSSNKERESSIMPAEPEGAQHLVDEPLVADGVFRRIEASIQK
jgi:hypothetical protein